VRSLEGKQKKSLSVVKNDIGEKDVEPKELLDLWKEYFEAPSTQHFHMKSTQSMTWNK